MPNDALYRTLVPNAPLYKRTDGDAFVSTRFNLRKKANELLVHKAALPDLATPRLISSCTGTIERILFCFPAWGVNDSELSAAYRSVIGALRVGTHFVVVHHAAVRDTVAGWFSAAGHAADHVILVSMPDYVALTDWAEDAYVSATDANDGGSFLIEPWRFLRSGDALIADAVEDRSDIQASQAPLIFQGGNCLVGDRFWILGKDYFVDTVDLLSAPGAPVRMPAGVDADAFVRSVFGEYVDRGRELIVVGTKRAIPLRDYIGTREGDAYYLDIPTGGTGAFQPIFHADMFLTLCGDTGGGRMEVLVGSPALADQMLGTRSPFALNEAYDAIAKDFSDRGLLVTRNPLVHWPTLGNTMTLGGLRQAAMKPGNEPLQDVVKELVAAGAVDGTAVVVRECHHVTWNNCLVENSATHGKHVYLPTFGHGNYAALATLDRYMQGLWEQRGFTVHALADFTRFAERMGVVHCIKKYIARSAA